MNHNVFLKICDKIEKPKYIYQLKIIRFDKKFPYIQKFFYKEEDLSNYVREYYLESLSNECSFQTYVRRNNYHSDYIILKYIREDWILSGEIVKMNLTTKEKGEKLFDFIIKNKIKDGIKFYGDNCTFIIEKKDIE